MVQKLIETMETKRQISLLCSALEPGFLTLIKDPNGNHVIQRCLQCFSNEDNKVRYCFYLFIFHFFFNRLSDVAFVHRGGPIGRGRDANKHRYMFSLLQKCR